MSRGLPQGALAALLQDLDALDRDAAVERVRGLAAADVPLEDLVTQLLGPAQVEVGRRWEAAERSVAWEHAVTAICDVALLAVAARVEVPRSRGRLLVACAELEWHSMPARMLTELLRERGWDAVLIGANAPADALVEAVQREDACALLVSCTMTVHLPGAWRAVQAGHRAGVPVLIGGAAFRDRVHATRLGADGSCDSPRQADAHLEQWQQERPAPVAADVDPEHFRLLAVGPELVQGASAEIDADERDVVRQDLADVVALLAAAVLVQDGTVLRDGLQWQKRYRTFRGQPFSGTRRAIRDLVPHLQDLDLPHSARLVRDYVPGDG